MDYKNVKRLLEKYWVGETSLQEEQLLKDYFNSDNVASDLASYRPLFVYFKQAQNKASTQSFKHISMERKTIVRALWLNRLSIAASIVLIIFAGFLCYDNIMRTTPSFAEQTISPKDTYKNPKAAYKEAKAALMLISKGLNKGVKKTKEGVRKVKD